MIITFIFGIISGFVPPNVFGAGNDNSQYSVDQMAARFGVTSSFLSEQLRKGYSLNQIYTALYLAEQDHISYEQAVASLFPSEENKSQAVTSDVYNKLSDAPLGNLISHNVTDDVYQKDEPDSVNKVTEDVYKTDFLKQSLMANVPKLPPIREEAPVYNKSSFNEAPYSVGDDKESISTLSGSLSLQNTDLTLPGRNGLGFSLTRQYDTNRAQFFDKGAEIVDNSAAVQNYYVYFKAMMKPVTKSYKVTYQQKRWVQEDTNGDGNVDVNTYNLQPETKVIGTYTTYEAASQAAGQKITYTTPSESRTETDYRRSTSRNDFVSSIKYDHHGFKGTLSRSGSPYVISGSESQPESIGAVDSCSFFSMGSYNSQGYYSGNSITTCGNSMYHSSANGFSGTLYAYNTWYSSTCPNYDISRANSICYVSGTKYYSGAISKPGYDTREWRQDYSGTVTKPGFTSDIGYSEWISNGKGGRTRTAFTMEGSPQIETIVSEGLETAVRRQTALFTTIAEAEKYRDLINSNPRAEIPSDDGNKYYIAADADATVFAEIVAYQPSFIFQNRTYPALEDQLNPLGKGWSWNLPYVETKEGKQYMHLGDGGSYEIEGDQLKDYDWKGLTFTPDTSVTVNGENSAYVLTSVDGAKKQYFSKDGQLLQIEDAYHNTIKFNYELNATYKRKLLSKVEDAIGNSIDIQYTATDVTLSKGNRTVVYHKHTEQGVELLDSVTDAEGRKTTYSYTLAPAKFNLSASHPERQISNPYALLTKVFHPTGASTLYTYEDQPVKRYIGSNSINEAYRAVSRVDQITYENNQTENYNRETIHYNSDMGESYVKDTSFSTVTDNGLVRSTFNYNKKFISADTPPQYYLDQSVVKAGDSEKSTAYQYGKQVTGKAYTVPVPTRTSSSNNQNGDVLTTAAEYDDYGNITSSVDEKGSQTAYTYDDKHRIKTVTEPIDSQSTGVTEYTRNPQGKVTQVIVSKDHSGGELLQKVNYSGIDAYGNTTVQTIANGNKSVTTTTEYSSSYDHAFPTKQSVEVTNIDGEKSTVTIQSDYDKSTGLITSSLDGKGQKTGYQYDALDRVKAVTYPDGKSIRLAYDDLENTVTVTNELGIRTKTRYNALGWNVESGLYEGNDYVIKSKSAYDANGRLVSSEDALGHLTRYGYDAWNRTTSTAYADGSEAVVKYDDALRQVTQRDGELNEQIQIYDKWNRLVQNKEKSAMDGNEKITSKIEYDAVSDQILKQTDANGNETQFSYNALGDQTSVTEPNSETTKYTYDMLGNLTRITYPDGQAKVKSYDELGRVIQTKDAKDQIEKRYFDANGNLSKKIDRNGNVTSFEYDSRNRLKSRVGKDETVSYVYDAAGKRLSMTDQTGTTSYAYDPYTEQLNTLSYPDGLKLSNQYDSNGNRTEMTGPFGEQVDYTYDLLNRLKTVGNTKDKPVSEYTYTKNGLLDSTISANGYRQQNQYNGIQLVELKHTRSNAEINSFQYSYDPGKNITKRTQNGVEDSFTYDKLNRIVTSSENQDAYSYDARGNRLTMETERAPHTKPRENSFDDQNRLTQVKIGGKLVEYRYNGDGLLTDRIQDGIHTRYYYDGNSAQIIAEATIENEKPVLKANYIRGLKLEAIAYADQTEAYPVYNGHGDIIEIRDSSGALLNQYQYDIWGNEEVKEEKVHNPFRYSGELWDDTTELQYLRARWYDPDSGRFINEDLYEGETEKPLSLNLYTYVTNNPLIFTDPSGQDHVFSQNYYNYLMHVMEHGSKGNSQWANARLDEERYYVDPNNSKDIVSYNELIRADANAREDYTSEFIMDTIISAGVDGFIIKGGTSIGKSLVSRVSRLFTKQTAIELGFEGGKAGEQFLAKSLGSKQTQVFFNTSLGRRYIDVMKDGIAHESKVGYTSLTSFVKKQIQKDAELIRTGDIEGAVWHFYKSGITGKVGATKPLLDMLDANGIKYIIEKVYK
ncbi:RHS repeat-associated core domain-containing protein [Paenibacillus farraposensis]|uniref:RHS repeat-associated core domain-containing protein n=2 Tax=Paenibacillus farraposensis TaxID=2807095 RepID=A0ABW4DB38_9BACL|nr:RHS repeat-associated core domain-containing protein [Paenibacillus farraposensis]